MLLKSLLALAIAPLVPAHYSLLYPEWRANTLDAPEGSDLNQFVYPCANAEFGSGNTTTWPLTGGPLQIELGHHWTYVFINLGLGNDTSDFNITLTPSAWNATGSGSLCVPKLSIPADSGVTDGAVGTLQVITVGASGSSLYNCADVKFSADEKAVTKAPECAAAEVQYVVLEDQMGGMGGHHGGNETEGGEGKKGEDKGNVAGVMGASVMSLTVFGGLAALFTVI